MRVVFYPHLEISDETLSNVAVNVPVNDEEQHGKMTPSVEMIGFEKHLLQVA